MENKHGIMRHTGIYLASALFLGLVIESLNRKSLFAGLGYMVESPLLFCFNVLIILLTLSFALFFKREIFAFVSVSSVWLLFGVVNFIILHFRVTPFSAVDFMLIKSAISVSGHYLGTLNIAMVIVALCLVVFLMACLYKKAPYHRYRNHRRIFLSGVPVIIIAFIIMFIKSSSSSVQALSTNYTNISEAYENYGFVYCFTNSLIDAGIARPVGYSEEAVKAITKSLDDKNNTRKRPNIIFIQLESFFDINYVKGLKCSKDPLPVFHALQKKYSGGLITVPTVGAGTVNTEFEVLTGMRQHDFGVCEYPYKTILKSNTSESICNDLAKLGYKSHSVHNNDALFYSRNTVFSSLGFDTFTSMEYMNGITENENGWANDDILAKEIIKTLDSTREPDFTFGITVQSHGKYDVVTDKKYKISVDGTPEGMESQYAYYVNQIAEVDKMIGNLIKQLKKRDEKTILVLYGDHLPSLELEADSLKNADLYQTQYVTWNNFGLEKQDRDLASYQLYSHILEQLDIHDGTITKYHQQKAADAEYLDGLSMLSYDLLYGENYAYDGTNPFVASDLQMGIDEIAIKNVEKNKDGYTVTGTGFTPYSVIYRNDEALDTEWIDSRHLRVYGSFDGETEEDEFVVKVIDKDGVILSTSTPVF